MNGSRWRYLLFGLLFFGFLFGPRIAEIFVDALWFDSLGYRSVYWYPFAVKWGLFLGFFALTSLLLAGVFKALSHAFAGYQLGGSLTRFDMQSIAVEPNKFMKPLARTVTLLWGLGAGLMMCARWEIFVLYFNGGSGGDPDPIFGKPLSFYLFAWPVYQTLVSWLTGLVVLTLLITLFYGFLTIISRMPRDMQRQADRTAALVCSLALAGVMAVYAWRLSLSRFSYLWHEQDIFAGVGYAQAKVLLPGLLIVAGTMIVAAVVAVLNAALWRRRRYLLLALAVPVASYLVLSVATNYVNNFIVKPNELERQTPYIKHNIDATRRAFGLDKIETRYFPVAAGTTAASLAQNRSSLENIRLWDWRALQATLRQVQVLRTYYDFPDVDVDRYRVNGKLRQVMVAARELDVERLPPASRNWVNERLVYTHGYGVTMNTSDGFTAEGRPRFLLSDVPVQSSAKGLELKRPEIYFGQKTDTPVYVKTRQKEFDFPQGETNAYTTYEGTGGIPLNGFLRRLLIAWSLGDLTKLPFSNDITSESRVLMYRNIRERVQRIAPFLSYDADPYIVVGNDGRLYWIMDGYTSSIYYPFATHYRNEGVWANYLRNSVKVVIDAYNGSVDYYVFDDKDPIIRAYRNTFPTLFHDGRDMPAGLREHIRYPELLFRSQADVYGLYHMKDVGPFFGREDVWSVAGEGITASNTRGPFNFTPNNQGQRVDETSAPLDPYFVLMPLPGEDKEAEFVQILPFTPSNRRNMVGWMAGRSDGENYGSLLTYNFPKSQLIDGPAQIRARINQDPYLSGQFTLWNQQESTILRGNMLVIPLGKSLLYVEPIFLQANQSPTPELRLVVLGTPERIVYGTSFHEALSKLLNSEGTSVSPNMASPATPAGEATTTDGTPSGGTTPGQATPGQTTPRQTTPPSKTPQTAPGDRRQQLIDRAAADLEAYQRLTAEGRYSEAGQRLESVRRSLSELRQPAR